MGGLICDNGGRYYCQLPSSAVDHLLAGLGHVCAPWPAPLAAQYSGITGNQCQLRSAGLGTGMVEEQKVP